MPCHLAAGQDREHAQWTPSPRSPACSWEPPGSLRTSPAGPGPLGGTAPPRSTQTDIAAAARTDPPFRLFEARPRPRAVIARLGSRASIPAYAAQYPGITSPSAADTEWSLRRGGRDRRHHAHRCRPPGGQKHVPREGKRSEQPAGETGAVFAARGTTASAAWFPGSPLNVSVHGRPVAVPGQTALTTRPSRCSCAPPRHHVPFPAAGRAGRARTQRAPEPGL